jgi:alpha-mannosidase/mannosylglycerate hydrolase
LLTLQDQEDIGDGWWHGPAVNTGLYSSTGAHADIAIIADGIHKATLKIRVHMNVPERFDFNEMVRTERHQPIEVSHTVTLRRDSDAIEVHTTVDNTVRDHRLRVFFPSDAKADTYLADGTFDVLERNIALREDNARYKELEVETKPQYTWTAVHDRNRGLAVITTGLPESTVRDTEDRPIALTLLRGFIKAVLTSGNEGGEIQGRYEFDYRIVPLAGKPDVSRLSRTGQQLAAGVRCTQIEPRDYLSFQPSEIPERSLPLRQSMLEIEAGEAIVSAIHQVSHDERASIRVFNPTGQRTKAKLSLAGTTQQAQLTDLEGKAHDDLAVRDNRVEVEIKPKQILTVRLS